MIRTSSRSNFSTRSVYAFLFLHLVFGRVQLGRGETSANSNLCFPLCTSSIFDPFLGIPEQSSDRCFPLEDRGDILRDVVFITYFDSYPETGRKLTYSVPREFAYLVNCQQTRLIASKLGLFWRIDSLALNLWQTVPA